MFLHLGGDVLINQEKIITILDLDTAAKGQSTENFLKNISNSGKNYYISDQGKEKSLIITTDGYYFSPISSTTLLKRSLPYEDQDE